jgi:hypothetical protein
MLTPEFAHSSPLHAARSLLHGRFATAESGAPARIAHRLDVFSWVLEGAGRYGLRCGVSRIDAAGNGTATVRAFVQRFTFRDDPRGGELTELSSEAEGQPREAAFVATRPEHRVRAFAYRWLWLWENAGDGSAFDEVLAGEGLEVRIRGGEPLATRAAVREEARRLSAGLGAMHHALAALEIAVSGPRYEAVAEIDWRGSSTGGTPLRARMRQTWELLDEGGRFPRLRRSRIEISEPLRAAVAEEAPGPPVANAPSDDAEAGGP